jgi:DNA-binding LytR/AlgR family response regulator
MITDLVSHYAEKYEPIEYCVACNDSVEGLKLLTNSNFDILFLDYNMPGLSGQDLLDLKKDGSKVIMITSNTEFAVDSYKYDDILDYLVKPLSYEAFLAAVERIETKMNISKAGAEVSESRTTIMLKDGNNWIPVNLTDIKFIKSESNYCVFHMVKGKIMSLATLKELEVRLPANYMRCHRSYIVNTDFITKVNLDQIAIDKDIIPISDMFRENVKSFIISNS